MKPIIKKLLFGVIAAVVVIGGAYLLMNRPGSSGQATGNEPAEFVTHASKDFSFEYPKGWFIQDIQNELNSYVQISNYDPDALAQTPQAQGNYFKLEIARLDNERSQPLSEWVSEFIKRQDYQTEVLSERPITVDSHEAIFQMLKIVPVNSIRPAIFIMRNSFIYLLNVGPLNHEFETVFNRIVESFRFKE